MAAKRKDKARVVLRTGEVQRKDGIYQFSWMDSQMKRRFVYARTLDDLREKEKHIQKDKCDGIKTEARYTTLDELFALWLTLKRGLKNNTFENYKYMYNTFVKPVIGNRKIFTLKKSDIKKYYNYLADERNLKACSGARVIEGINDLATLKPLLAQEWSEKNKLKPTEISVASHKKIIWKCKHGHEWEASVKSRTVNGTGCPYCSHNKVLAGFNDLASQYPDIAAEWSDRNLPLLPTMVTAFANSKAWWKCKDCGNEWHTLISTRADGSRCPYCSGYTLLKGFNDLATTHPELAAEWSERNYPLMPDEVNAKSRRNVWWKCKTCGNEWKSVINARVKGTVCPVCADRAVLAGYNDLATTDRRLLAEWDYETNSLLPTQVSRRSMKSVWWKCSLGHSWKAKISDRTIIGEKCTVCEKEYRSVFPGLAVAYYANQKGLKVQLGSDKLLGIR